MRQKGIYGTPQRKQKDSLYPYGRFNGYHIEEMVLHDTDFTDECQENEDKLKALQKLTAREKELLGLA